MPAEPAAPRGLPGASLVIPDPALDGLTIAFLAGAAALAVVVGIDALRRRRKP